MMDGQNSSDEEQEVDDYPGVQETGIPAQNYLDALWQQGGLEDRPVGIFYRLHHDSSNINLHDEVDLHESHQRRWTETQEPAMEISLRQQRRLQLEEETSPKSLQQVSQVELTRVNVDRPPPAQSSLRQREPGDQDESSGYATGGISSAEINNVDLQVTARHQWDKSTRPPGTSRSTT
ncbi:uncharacterized protein LOC121369207 isoform X2 [Gigantopelta aegis]|uniref:uncharacterized protein LOC121369207 isoform X2 n=1 Tax=Gigantopelta aegis TaxID=1735272 RepID=UPI001B88C1DA|nr:uncharacterized protein LOC121369207 isoform X2 [Gigantopelta aegis]